VTLENARVLVVGGTSGIGLATALAARRAGARVVVAGRSEEGLRRAREADAGLETRAVDMMGPELRAVVEDLGALDHLVVTAADAVAGRITDLDEARADRCWRARCGVRAGSSGPR
jgi:NAD(P)-dependent dehydrogenase (short-subunit alcohol dehydrogenase family)